MPDEGVLREDFLDLDRRGEVEPFAKATQARLGVANAPRQDHLVERVFARLLRHGQREGDHLIGRSHDLTGDISDRTEQFGLHGAVFGHDHDLIGLGQTGEAAVLLSRQA